MKHIIVNPYFGLEDCNGKSTLVLDWVEDVPREKIFTIFKFCLSDSFTGLVFYFELMFFFSICFLHVCISLVIAIKCLISSYVKSNISVANHIIMTKEEQGIVRDTQALINNVKYKE